MCSHEVAVGINGGKVYKHQPWCLAQGKQQQSLWSWNWHILSTWQILVEKEWVAVPIKTASTHLPCPSPWVHIHTALLNYQHSVLLSEISSNSTAPPLYGFCSHLPEGSITRGTKAWQMWSSVPASGLSHNLKLGELKILKTWLPTLSVTDDWLQASYLNSQNIPWWSNGLHGNTYIHGTIMWIKQDNTWERLRTLPFT